MDEAGVTRRFGDRARFGVEVGEIIPISLRTVDLWAGGKWLTVDDNAAFLPSFLHSMRTSADEVRRGEISATPYPGRSPEEIFNLLYADDETSFREQFWLLHWGETVDNVISYLWADGDDLVIAFRFWRPTHPFPEELGQTFVARIPADEFATVLTEAADFMAADLPR